MVIPAAPAPTPVLSAPEETAVAASGLSIWQNVRNNLHEMQFCDPLVEPNLEERRPQAKTRYGSS